MIAKQKGKAEKVLFGSTNFIQVWRQHNIEAESAAVERQRDFSRTHIIIGAVVPAILLWSLWREGLSQFLKTYPK